MLRLVIVLAILALIAGFFGFAGAASYLMDGARIILFIFIIIAGLCLLGSAIARQPSKK